MSATQKDDITAKLLTGLRNRIENKTTAARADNRQGDLEWFNGEKTKAGIHYRAALKNYIDITNLQHLLDEMHTIWLPLDEDRLADIQWAPIENLEHRGVGEGDTGLPEPETDMIPAVTGYTIPAAAFNHEADERGFGRNHPSAECKAENPHLSGFIGPDDTATS